MSMKDDLFEGPLSPEKEKEKEKNSSMSKSKCGKEKNTSKLHQLAAVLNF